MKYMEEMRRKGQSKFGRHVRKYHGHYLGAIVAVSLVILISSLMPGIRKGGFMTALAEIVNGAPAVNELGQNDEAVKGVLTTHYNKFAANDVPSRRSIVGAIAQVIDPVNHRLFVSDYTGGRILVFSLGADNKLTTDRTADYVIGRANFNQVRPYSETPSQTNIYSPWALAYDQAHNRLFVSDSLNNRVLVYNVSPSNMANGMAAMAVIGQSSFTSFDRALTATGLYSPYGLAYDEGNNQLFVADSLQNRVLVYDVSNLSDGQTGLAASNVIGQDDFTSRIYWETSEYRISQPLGLIYDADHKRLFVSIFCQQQRVLVYDVTTIENGEAAVNVLGQPDFTSNAGTLSATGLNSPNIMAYDAENQRLFVSDQNNRRVMVFDVNTINNGEAAINVLGQPNFTTVTGPVLTVDDKHFGPYGLNYDPQNKLLYVTHYGMGRIMIFNVATEAIYNYMPAVDVLGQGSLTSLNAVSKEGLSGPIDVEIDATNRRLYVADRVNNRVLAYNLDTQRQLIDRLPDNVLGQPDFGYNLPILSQTGLKSPRSLIYDSAHNYLLVTRDFAGLLGYDASSMSNGKPAYGVLFSDFAGTNVDMWGYDAIDLSFNASTKYLYASHRYLNRVSVWNFSNPANTVIVDNLGCGSQLPPSACSFNNPVATAFDATHNRLYVADMYNNRVLIWNLSSQGAPMKQDADYVLGQTSFTSADYGTSASQMGSPGGLTYDEQGQRLFVSDTGNGRVLVFDMSSTLVNGQEAISVLGKMDFIGTPGPTGQHNLKGPRGLAYDPITGLLYVADVSGNRIMVFNVGAAQPAYTQGVNVLVRGTTVGANGAAPGQTVLAGAIAKAFSTSDSCVTNYAGDFDGMNATCKPAAICTTIANGTCTLKMAPGMYRVLVTSDQFPGQISKDANVVQVKENSYEKKNYIFVQTVDGKVVGGTSRLITGSELWIYEPTAVLWDSTQAYYPFVFESDSDWSINVCLNPPEGYVVDHGSQDCIQTGVANESKTIIFKMVEVGSVPSPANVAFNIKHAGKSQVVKSKIEARLSLGLAQKKGMKIDKFGRVGK